jgi:hypothetical protein
MDKSAGNCQQLSGDSLPGANSYYWGEYAGNADDGWSGQESFYVFMNDTSKSQGDADCIATWDVVATASNVGKCPTCDVALSVSAKIASDTCPDGLSGDTTFSTEYSVDLADDGSATWYFSSSGTYIGAGYWNKGGMNYLTDSSCRWF